MSVTEFVEMHLPPCWVIAPFILFTAHLTWSVSPSAIATGPIGRIWLPISIRSPRVIEAPGTLRARVSKWAPKASGCWAAHDALLRAGAEDGSWEGHDNRWWVDYSSWIATGCNTGLATGIHHWLWACHLTGCKAAGADHLSIDISGKQWF